MHTSQVDALPPNHGRMNLPSTSCTWNSRKPASVMVAANTSAVVFLEVTISIRHCVEAGVTKVEASRGLSSPRP